MSLARNLQRPGSDWRIFARAYGWVWLVRISLWVLPFRKVYEWTIRFRQGRVGDRLLSGQEVYKVVWAVAAAARRTPGASCLTQALATQIMLGRRGHRTLLQLGIMKKEKGKLDAHAWLEREGKVIIGMTEAFEQLTRLPLLDGENEESWRNS